MFVKQEIHVYAKAHNFLTALGWGGLFFRLSQKGLLLNCFRNNFVISKMFWTSVHSCYSICLNSISRFRRVSRRFSEDSVCCELHMLISAIDLNPQSSSLGWCWQGYANYHLICKFDRICRDFRYSVFTTRRWPRGCPLHAQEWQSLFSSSQSLSALLRGLCVFRTWHAHQCKNHDFGHPLSKEPVRFPI